MTITNWNESTLEKVRSELLAAMKTVTDKYGLLPVNGAHMRYSANKVTVKFDVYVKPENLAPNKFTDTPNPQASALNRIGIPLGTVLRSTRYGNCKVIGYNSRKRKFPIITRNAQDQEIGFPENCKHAVVSYPEGYQPPSNSQAGTLTLRPFPGQR